MSRLVSGFQRNQVWRTVCSLLPIPAIVVVAVAVLGAAPARAAGPVECPPVMQPLVKIPEIAAVGHRLKGTILLNDQEERVIFRRPPTATPGAPSATQTCYVQYMRAYHAEEAPNATAETPDPLPGPTLRARIGDIIELTFLNQINPADFGASIDQDITAAATHSAMHAGYQTGSMPEPSGAGCDQTNRIYPRLITPATDKSPAQNNLFDHFPDCFHGSSTGNIHFHGTHTNPDGTGDNVLIQVRPSNPQQDGKNAVTAATVQKPFDAFYQQCEAHLAASPLVEWPKVWSDLPRAFTEDQETRLRAYDAKYHQALWPADEMAIHDGVWPEFYMGAYPYCFQLPKYTETTYPPPASPGAPVLQMGQSPGTAWYHAHKHGSTAIDVSNGMSGVFIIEGEYDDALNRFYHAVPNWTRSQPVMLVNQIGGTPNLEMANAGRTDKGQDFSVNGRLQPKIHMYPGEVQMWRIVNSSPRSAMYLPALPPGFEWRQLAQDGVQLAPDNYAASGKKPLTIASGNRVDLLVKAPSAPLSAPVPLQVEPNVASAEINIVPDAATRKFPTTPPAAVTLLWLEVSGTGPAMDLIPPDKLGTFPPYLTNVTDQELNGPPREIDFMTGPPQSKNQQTINGKQFSDTDPSNWQKVDKVNTAEEWKIANNTTFQPIDHPFHIHINPFQVTEVFDPNQVIKLPDGTAAYKYVFNQADLKDPAQQCLLDLNNKDSWKPCKTGPTPAHLVWWDVFPIPSGRSVPVPGSSPASTVTVGGYFKMRTRFVDFPGTFVLHCHILAHEDRGMMTIVAVGVSEKELANVHHH
jgi:FtsP/CotA-like multicopper oxidase with cupredoxin domain